MIIGKRPKDIIVANPSYGQAQPPSITGEWYCMKMDWRLAAGVLALLRFVVGPTKHVSSSPIECGTGQGTLNQRF